MKICICVGSSCHLNGSYGVIERLKANVEKHGLANSVELSASFCLNHCREGVSIQLNDDEIFGVSPETVDAWFAEHVLGRGQV